MHNVVYNQYEVETIMSKMLLTQLNGLFQKILQNEEAIEETSRLLAQASVGQGKIYIACFGEMKAIEWQAIYDKQFHNLTKWDENVVISEVDRVWIFTNNHENEQVIQLAKRLNEQFIPFAVIAPENTDEQNDLSELAYTYIPIKIRGGGILPHPTKLGERIITPYVMAALFIYESVKLNYIEIIDDYE